MRDFNHTVNVLVKAYLNGTLEHGNCFACAVGNVVADAICVPKYKVLEFNGRKAWDETKETPEWSSIFFTDSLEGMQSIHPEEYKGVAKNQVDSTGYTWQELAQVESAFEKAQGLSVEERMFDGLMKVCDVLADIHGISLEQKTEAKAMFVKETL